MSVSSPTYLESELRRYETFNQRSLDAHRRRAQILPGGATRNTVFFDPYPPTMVGGTGSIVTDLDGNERVDFLNNYTALILGHAHPAVVDAVTTQVQKGSAFGAPTELESELGAIIKSRVPSIERLRFCNSGTEATMQAMRAARAFTGRDAIAMVNGGYQGTHDWAMAPGPGIPNDVSSHVARFSFNDLDSSRDVIERNANRLAAIIVEPIMGAAGIIAPEPGYLESLRELTRAYGILLIFDEIMVFRTGYGGAQSRYGVAPDLTTLAKIIGGGFPVAAWGGRADVMELLRPGSGSVQLGGTYNGSPVGLAAGIATLDLLQKDDFDALNGRGEALSQRLNAIFSRRGVPAQVTCVGSLFNIHWTADPIRCAEDARAGANYQLRTLFIALLNKGYYLAPRGMGSLSTAISEGQIDALCEAVDDVVGNMAVDVEA
ncbi:MAG: aspartate aminotransferase family protein [Chloroflexi bacterium]|nr:aspartate aminotransferase family protein [Chloroflexota bacterium]